MHFNASNVSVGRTPSYKFRLPWFGTAGVVVFGVVLPLGVILLEAATGMCASTFYDPIPTIWHVLLALTVPAGNLITWIMLGREVRWRRQIGWINAFTMGVAFYFSALFVPLLPLAMIAILAFGLGLLPLAPLFSLIVAFNQRLMLRRWTVEGLPARVPGFFIGIALAALAILAVQAPVTLTNVGLHLATSQSQGTEATGIDLLRRFGSVDRLRLACDDAGARDVDLISWGLSFGSRVAPQEARRVFYRVTGQSYLGTPLPRDLTRTFVTRGQPDDRPDAQLGSDQIGVRLTQLSLADSRLDGVIDANAGIAYLEWIMVFRNDHPWAQREARTHIALPAGGVVSRCTLWINGEEREAAFGGRAETTRAYQSVAVQQRRDPLLVTTAGSDRILVQCFPIQPGGAQMKIRVGMTVPMQLDDLANMHVALPTMLERNFGIADDVKHAVWLTSPVALSSSNSQFRAEADPGSGHALRGALADSEMAEGSVVRISRSSTAAIAWTDEPVAGQKRRIVQEIISAPTVPPAAVVVALDLSRSMHGRFTDVVTMLSQLPQGTQVAVLGAADEVVDLTNGPKSLSPEFLEQLRQSIAKHACRGGADNVPALERAWDLADKTTAPLIWIHGPQPELFRLPESIIQRLQRRPDVPIVSLQLGGGVNRVVEGLDGLIVSQTVQAGDQASLLDSIRGPSLKYQRREMKDDESVPPAAIKTSGHLARLWAADQVAKLLKTSGAASRKEAIQIGSGYQLVTAATGAVVLETAEQYAQNNLQPAESGSTPGIPEPSGLLLLLLPTTYLLSRRPGRVNAGRR